MIIFGTCWFSANWLIVHGTCLELQPWSFVQHYFCIFLLIICPFFIKIYFCFYFNFILFVKKSSFSYVIKAYSIQVRAMRMFRYILFEHPMPCHEFKKCEFNNCNWHDTTNHHVHLIIKGMFIVFYIFNILLFTIQEILSHWLVHFLSWAEWKRTSGPDIRQKVEMVKIYNKAMSILYSQIILFGTMLSNYSDSIINSNQMKNLKYLNICVKTRLILRNKRWSYRSVKHNWFLNNGSPTYRYKRSCIVVS